jgi:hypothetical protein
LSSQDKTATQKIKVHHINSMKNLLKTTLMLVVLALTGCSEKKSRDFFAKGGITAGAAAALGSGSYKIPMEFETEIVHSGQWIDAVDATVSGSDILITASFISGNRKGSYPGYVKINGVSPGTYTLKYRDPDGTIHAIGPVVSGDN